MGAKLLRHYGTKKVSHPEFISGSVGAEMLKQVQHDNMFVQGDNAFVYGDNPRVIARSETTKQSQYGMALKRLLRYARNDGAEGTFTLPTFKPLEKLLWGIRKKCAFTLSEVLIVLAVLGVIAAITIPDLIQDAREKALITALQKSYTVFSQAVDMAQAENGSMTDWDIGPYAYDADGALKLYNILKPYLRIEKECGTKSGCFATHYETLTHNNYGADDDTDHSTARGVLAGGASFRIQSYGTCSNSGCGMIGVDVNGRRAPNQAGVDYFEFIITEDGLQPRGDRNHCLYNGSGVFNGSGCTYWVIKHGNMDYLRKDGQYEKS